MTEHELACVASRHPAVRFALLFGSRATGTARPDSDWDLAIYVDPSLDARQRFDLKRELAGELAGPELTVDVVILNDAPPLLAHRALAGKPLVMADRSSYVAFFVKTLAASFDEQYWRDLHARERSARLKEGRFGRP